MKKKDFFPTILPNKEDNEKLCLFIMKIVILEKIKEWYYEDKKMEFNNK